LIGISASQGQLGDLRRRQAGDGHRGEEDERAADTANTSIEATAIGSERLLISGSPAYSARRASVSCDTYGWHE
jgi:hypothetical protein